MQRRQANLLVARAHTRYRDRTLDVRRRTVLQVRQQWLAMPDYRDASAARFANSAALTVSNGRAVTAALTVGFIAVVGSAAGVTVTGTPAGLTTARGVPLTEQWMRPAVEVWSRLADGRSVTAAISAGLTRAETMAATDLQLAKTATTADVLTADPNATGYHRVVGPNACPLCEDAEGEYSDTDEMALHDNCACDAVPIFEGVPWTDLATSRPDPPTLQSSELGTRLA